MVNNTFTDLVFAFAELSKRLLEIDVEMSSLKILLGYGSWEMVAIKGEEACKFEFDGKDSILRIQASPIRQNPAGQRYAPNDWSVIEHKAFPQRRKSEIAYAESFLRNKFSNSSNEDTMA